MKQHNEEFFTYQILPGFNTIKDIEVAMHTLGNHEATLRSAYDNFTMKTKRILTRFRLTFGTIKFNEKSFFNTLLGFTSYWDYKPTKAIHADSPGVYTCDKILILSTMDKIYLKCDVIDRNVVNGLRQPTVFSFILDKPSGYKMFCEPETINYKK